jgi:hypothetical protein
MEQRAQDLKNSTSLMCVAIGDHLKKALPESGALQSAIDRLTDAGTACDAAIDFAFGDANPEPKESAEPSAPAAADAGPATETAETPTDEIDDAEFEQLKNSDPGAYAMAMAKKSAS